ncbi:hypothetical protein VP01_3516g2 [Puccinia sorghi]|uniref:Uncharacterized protein n=1 Tax=Puccinia sorghi TaxID=27349 RepID=A0A0L6UWE8_9BASI|nr:hypothetical protein VP01_3516g2 [Puccinia sorghi]
MQLWTTAGVSFQSLSFSNCTGGKTDSSMLGSGIVGESGRPDRHWWNQLLVGGWWICGMDKEEVVEEEVSLDFTHQGGVQLINALWFPFFNKEAAQSLAQLVMGHMHNIISFQDFEKFRCIWTIFDINLAHWTTLRYSRDAIQQMLGMNPIESMSIFGNRCYPLSVQKIIDLKTMVLMPKFISEHKVEVGVCPWSPSTNVQLKSGSMVIPIFLYSWEGILYSKCVTPRQKSTNDANYFNYLIIPTDLSFNSLDLIERGVSLREWCGGVLWEKTSPKPQRIIFPNPWRAKAAGKVIRNVPITLYSDDTAGNLSKQWNKHLSYYFSLSGLPHKHEQSAIQLPLSCHIKHCWGSRIGFVSYDAKLGKDVLDITMVLCFLGDSPMHAGIKNTPIPSSSLNPCRICNLSVESRNQKASINYVKQFVGINHLGETVCSLDIKSRQFLYCLYACEDHTNKFE